MTNICDLGKYISGWFQILISKTYNWEVIGSIRSTPEGREAEKTSVGLANSKYQNGVNII